jgi:predicted NACHT family NTPase
MTSPGSDEKTPTGQLNVQISKSQGIVIGDHVQVTQQFYGTLAEPQVDLIAAEVTYRQQVVDMYKWLNFNGFDQPDLFLDNVPLEDIFVRLALTVEKVIREPVVSETSSQARMRKSQERVITVQEPIELSQALNNHLLIVGEPGAGKSTLLRWLAVIFAQGHQQAPNRLGPSADANRLPVLVELGRLPNCYVKSEGGETPNWLQFLPHYLTTQTAFTNTPPHLLIQALADDRCLLLFDGLDEIADRQARTRLTRSLVDLARLRGNRVVISSRPAGVSESKGALHHYFQLCQIERFTPEDVHRFFHFWYALDRGLTPEEQHDAANALYAQVQATPAILHLARTPLLSTILMLIWRNEGNLPERRVDLYQRCCSILIEHWEDSHEVAYKDTRVHVAQSLSLVVEKGNEAVMKALLEMLRDTDKNVELRTVESLKQIGASNKVVVNVLLEMLHAANKTVRANAIKLLGHTEIKDTVLLRHVLIPLIHCLYYNKDDNVRSAALVSIQQLLDGRPIPDYRWVPLKKQRRRNPRLK